MKSLKGGKVISAPLLVWLIAQRHRHITTNLRLRLSSGLQKSRGANRLPMLDPTRPKRPGGFAGLQTLAAICPPSRPENRGKSRSGCASGRGWADWVCAVKGTNHQVAKRGKSPRPLGGQTCAGFAQLVRTGHTSSRRPLTTHYRSPPEPNRPYICLLSRRLLTQTPRQTLRAGKRR